MFCCDWEPPSGRSNTFNDSWKTWVTYRVKLWNILRFYWLSKMLRNVFWIYRSDQKFIDRECHWQINHHEYSDYWQNIHRSKAGPEEQLTVGFYKHGYNYWLLIGPVTSVLRLVISRFLSLTDDALLLILHLLFFFVWDFCSAVFLVGDGLGAPPPYTHILWPHPHLPLQWNWALRRPTGATCLLSASKRSSETSRLFLLWLFQTVGQQHEQIKQEQIKGWVCWKSQTLKFGVSCGCCRYVRWVMSFQHEALYLFCEFTCKIRLSETCFILLISKQQVHRQNNRFYSYGWTKGF